MSTLTDSHVVPQAKVYFKETFDAGWEDRWVKSVFPGKSESDMGEWKHTAGEWHADPEDKGIQTGTDAKHYGLSALMDEAFTSEGKDLVIQYTVKFEQKIDCGGCVSAFLSRAPRHLSHRYTWPVPFFGSGEPPPLVCCALVPAPVLALRMPPAWRLCRLWLR